MFHHKIGVVAIHSCCACADELEYQVLLLCLTLSNVPRDFIEMHI